MANVNDGDDARELRELVGPLEGPAGDLIEREVDDVAELFSERRASRMYDGLDLSLSAASELASSKSPALLAEPEVRLRVEELALMSFSLSFPSKPMNILERASL